MEKSDPNSNPTNGTVKKGSYPSRQKRFGPAPLASFEDLPSDDQASSPDDDDDDKMREISPDPFAIERALEYDSNALLESNYPLSPTRTITPTCISPPNFSSQKRGSDTASQNTITIRGNDGTDSATPVATPEAGKSGSFASLNLRPDTRGSVSSSGPITGHGSAGNLLAPPSSNESPSPSHESKRKGSWTDIFFHRDSRGRSKSQSSAVPSRKSPTNDGEPKKKKGIFKIFIFGGKKSPSKDVITSPIIQHQTPGIEITDTPRVSVTDTSENEPREELVIPSSANEPKPSEQDIIGIYEAAQRQMDHTPIEDIPVPLPPLNLRKKLRRRESTIDDEVQSLPEVLPSSRSKERDLTLTPKNVKTVVAQIESGSRDERESSESEMGFDESTKSKSKLSASNASDNDVEAENLLTQESVDYDNDNSGSEYFNVNLVNNNVIVPEYVKSPTRKERLEVTTIPIDRPRSTTPINIVPLEAYIRSTSISPDPNVEKIKLSLPGEQFTATARAKSPRKSNPSIWIDFCEKGLQSPRSRRKQRNNSYTCGNDQETCSHTMTDFDAFTPTQALSPSPGNTTPMTPSDGVNGDNKWPGFGDNFVDFNNILSSNGVNSCDNNDKFTCTCDCNTQMALTADNNNTFASDFKHSVDSEEGACITPQTNVSTPADESNKNSSLSPTEHEDEPLVPSCRCICHHRNDFALNMFKSSSMHKQESVSSDISSASSRLLGSSSSASKCSPTDETVELNS